MPKPIKPDIIYRIIDANINRAKEGLRVCEEVARFVLNDRGLTAGLKSLRHRMQSLSAGVNSKAVFLKARNIRGDVGREVGTVNEFKRNNCADIFFANIQRVKESLRVLEEFAKLNKPKQALSFKRLRYTVYEIEKRVALKSKALRGFKI